MREPPAFIPTPAFKSCYADLLTAFLAEKHMNFKYSSETTYLRQLDNVLVQQGAKLGHTNRECFERWIAARPGEHPLTQENRVRLVRQFARYLVRNGISAYVPQDRYLAQRPVSFAPRVFSFAEIRNLLGEVDRLKPYGVSRISLRHLVMPEVFRILYGCGLRINEVMRLRVKDVDLHEGILTVHNTKFGKHRLVPMAPSLVRRLKHYQRRIGSRDSNAYFFPAPDGGRYASQSVYVLFRELLPRIGLIHRGRGYGPRLHDLRHTYAVHRLILWYREGVNLEAKIAVLATYLGHTGVAGTQKYLHLVPELFPEVTAGLEELVEHVIPKGEAS